MRKSAYLQGTKRRKKRFCSTYITCIVRIDCVREMMMPPFAVLDINSVQVYRL